MADHFLVADIYLDREQLKDALEADDIAYDAEELTDEFMQEVADMIGHWHDKSFSVFDTMLTAYNYVRRNRTLRQ